MTSGRGFHRLPDPVPALTAQLAATIVADMSGWRVDYAGARVGSDYSGMSKLRNGDLRRFSLQALVRMAARIGLEVTLTTQAVPRRIARNSPWSDSGGRIPRAAPDG